MSRGAGWLNLLEQAGTMVGWHVGGEWRVHIGGQSGAAVIVIQVMEDDALNRVMVMEMKRDQEGK